MTDIDWRVPTREVIGFTMTITPEIAKEMLGTSPGNRNISSTVQHNYSNSIKRGAFCVSTDAIGFDWNGCLLNGHHRLSACVFSGQPIEAFIATGFDPDIYSITDSGRNRTLGARLKGRKDNNFSYMYTENKVSIYRLASAMTYGKHDYNSTDLIEKIINAGLGAAVNTLFGTASTKRNRISTTGFRLGACFLLMTLQKEKDKDYVLSQYKSLVETNYNDMSVLSQHFIKQLDLKKLTTVFIGIGKSMQYNMFVLATIVLDPKNKDKKRVIPTDATIKNEEEMKIYNDFKIQKCGELQEFLIQKMSCYDKTG